jgi:hypothetical protein
MTHHEHADFSKHTDEELQEGIRKADEQRDRVQREDSAEALEAHDHQRQAMAEELERRQA